MANNKVFIDVVIDDKGTTKRIAVEANKLGAALDTTGKSARTADRNLKGAAQTSANGTKNFSKMAQGISGGLVPAYATLAANIFAVTAAFSFFKSAADLRVVQESQENFAKSTGTSLSLLTSRIQEATDGVLTFQEAAQAVSIGTASGLNSEQLTGLAKVAKNASLALGRDLSDSFDRLVRGATKAEPELLDELGIILRLETATEKYGTALNKNAKDLTAYQRTQAVVNEILEQGNQKFDDLGGQVNKVAKLGKAFNDLLKNIKGALNPIAEFFAGALSNNVLALAGAFTLLGQGVLKAIVPVAPALADIGEAADAATKRIQAALPEERSTLGKNIASGDIGGREIAALERTTTAANSKVIDYSKTTRQAVTRDVAIIKANHEAMIAQNTSGFKRYVASAKAEMFSLQATHGKVMGTMTALTNQLGRVASKIIGAAGLIGLLFTALGIIKELLEKLKDPALLKALELTKAVREAAAEQNEAVSEILNGLINKSGTVQENIVDLANTISNLNFSPFEKLSLSLEGLKEDSSGVLGLSKLDFSNTNIQEFVGSLAELKTSIELQRDILQRAGKDTTELDTAYNQLSTRVLAFQNAIKSARAGTGNLTSEDFKTNAENLLEFVIKLPALLKTSNTALVDQGAAFKSLKQIGEEYADFTSSLVQTNTEFSRSMDITKNALDSVTGAMADGNQDESFLKVFQDTEGGEAVLRILKGMTQEEREKITVREVLEELQEKNNRLLAIENSVLLQQTKTLILKEKSMRNLTPLQKGLLDNEFKQRNILDQIGKIQGERALLTEEEIAQDSSRAKQLDLQLGLLREQLETVRQQSDAFLELSNSAKAAFEGATQGGIAELIKGDESSIKDAMLKIAKATLSAVADTLAKQITEKITGALFGTPEDKIRQAHMEGAEVVKQKIKEGHQEGLATTVPGKVPTPTNLVQEVKNSSGTTTGTNEQGPFATLFGNLIGKKAGRDDSAARRSDPSSMPATGAGVLEEVVASSEGGASGLTRLFTSFTDNMKGLFGGNDAPFLENLGNLFVDLGTDFGSIFSTLTKDLGGLFSSLPDLLGTLFGGMGGGGAGGIFGTLATLFFANGGIAKGGFRSAAYAKGGIATQPTVGLVGEGRHNEAIVPLPDGKSIPVSMNGVGQNSNVTVNVAIDSNGNTSQNSEGQGQDLGIVIAAAVQKELQNQKRSGGILNPYGAA
ncbi:MAG: hypothetical protein CMP84_16010 [Gammaproteobacteria bacterium]|nr:hypothetical protein [Gammaproteobacteria bacterium]